LAPAPFEGEDDDEDEKEDDEKEDDAAIFVTSTAQCP
jgi:hypothetical protein